MDADRHILLIAPYFDQNDPGENWSTFKWVEGVSRRFKTTVLTTNKKEWDVSKSPTNAVEIVNWVDPTLPESLTRLDWELRPGYLLFYCRVKLWIKRALRQGVVFDLIHQVSPLALRYPSPARAFNIPYVIGPLAGSLANPTGFSTNERQWYRKLRNLDKLRIKYDPFLRSTYTRAAIVLGVAPYVRELLGPINVSNVILASETGVESVMGEPKVFKLEESPLRLLFVGRIIRTKGVIDAIRAVAILSEKVDVTFDILGTGDMDEECHREIKRLGVDGVVRMHGRVTREQVEQWYRKSHVFLFPSYREPSGNVVFEAMSHGLPVITSDRGGPGFVVDEFCGTKVEPLNPEQYALDIASAIEEYANNPEKISVCSENAMKRIEEIANWEKKIEDLVTIYRKVWSQRE